MQKLKILFLLAAAAGAAWLTTWVDNGRGMGWTANVVRNWEQHGLLALHGRLADNPGGYEAVSHPEIYAGHRAASLYPAFLCHHLLGGSDAGFLLYYALMAALVALSVWQMLGRTERGFWLAVITVLTPGYVRWQTTIDPNLQAVLFGFPFCAGVLRLFSEPVWKWFHWAALVLLIAVFSLLNWTTVFVHSMLFVALLAMGRRSWRHLIAYAGLTGVLAGTVVLASVVSKAGTNHGSGGGLANLLSDYGWGSSGYGLDLSTTTACLRLLTANIVGLLPLLIFLGWRFWRGRQETDGLVFLVPAVVPVVEVLGMRNYFGHHPWMSIHFILLGIILSAVVWKKRAVKIQLEEKPPALGFRLGSLAGTFAYGTIVLAVVYAHNLNELNLVTFVQQRTPRDTTILINQASDPGLAGMQKRLPEMFDRHMAVMADARGGSLAAVPGRRMVLTAAAPPAGLAFIRTDAAGVSPALQNLLGWYSRHIARRRAGDKLEIGEKYFLYQPAN